MKKLESGFTTKQLARITGLFYLLIIACGLFSGIVVRESLVDLSDPMGTLQQIMRNKGQYRTGFLCDLVMVVCDVIVSVLFFILLRKVDWNIAILATAFRLVQSAVLGANLLNLFSPLLLIAGMPEGDVVQMELLATSLIHQIRLFDYGYLISGVFFSFNCLLMGYLIRKSGFIPGIWGVFLTMAGCAYLINCLAHFAMPAWAEFTQLLVLLSAVFAELGLCLYLLIKGSRTGSSPALAP